LALSLNTSVFPNVYFSSFPCTFLQWCQECNRFLAVHCAACSCWHTVLYILQSPRAA